MIEKQIAILKTILQTASAIGGQIKIAYPKKKLFAKDKYLRTPGKRIKKKRARMMIPLTAAIGAAQVRIIASQPIYKSHNFKPGGLATVGEGKTELIMVNGVPQMVTADLTLSVKFNDPNYEQNKEFYEALKNNKHTFLPPQKGMNYL